MNNSPAPFLQSKGNFRNLIVFQKSQCIYDITCVFVRRFLNRGDRTIDQMVQAARSGKQNIAEGSAASMTSSETEIKLMNVAKASLQELLLDYEDFLRINSLLQWQQGYDKYEQAKRVCRSRSDSQFFSDAAEVRSAETVANIAITLIHQTDWLLARLLETLQRKFLAEGGVREQMKKARTEYKKTINKSSATSESAISQKTQ